VSGLRFYEGGFDRDEVVLPEMVWEDRESPADALIEELVDIFWQAGGSDEKAPTIKISGASA
jgi:hypothetical protein